MSMAEENCSTKRDTSLFSLQIQYLDKKLERCQLRCDELEKQNKNLILQCKTLEEDETGCEILKRKMAEKEEEVKELAAKLETQRQVSERALKELKLQQSLELQELQEQADKLNSQIREQDARSEEQRRQKEQLEQQLSVFEALEEEVQREKKKHEAAVKDLEESMESEIDSLIHERRKTLTDWAKTKIRETIWEETAQAKEVEGQITKVLDKIDSQKKERVTTKKEEAKLNLEIHNLEAAAAGMEKRVSTKETEKERQTLMNQQLETGMKKRVSVYESIMDQTDQLRQQLSSAMEENFQKTNMAAQLEAELQEERTRQAVLEDDMMKAVIVLRHVQEAPGEAMWTLLSQDLLRILERNLPEAEESTLRDSIETRSGARGPQTPEPESERAETLNMATDPLFLLTRCRPGDFGLIPRPSWKLRPLKARCSPLRPLSSVS